MNKLFLSLLLLSMTTSLFGQERNFKHFRVSLGQDLTSLSNLHVIPRDQEDWTVCIEPSYRINDRFMIGLRYEVSIRNASVKNMNPQFALTNYSPLYGSDVDMGASLSFNVQWYLLKNSLTKIRPFVGVGVGRFGTPASYVTILDFNSSYTGGVAISKYEVSRKLRWGFYPRVGLDFHHFYFSIDYNFVAPSKSKLIDYSEDFKPTRNNPLVINSYLSCKLGFFIGGGRLKSLKIAHKL